MAMSLGHKAKSRPRNRSQPFEILRPGLDTKLLDRLRISNITKSLKLHKTLDNLKFYQKDFFH